MTNKSQKCYEHALKYFEEHVFALNCVSFTTDYERAMRNALRKLHPNTKQYGCYFHYCQAVKKNAWKTAGLVNLIRSNPNARSVYFRIMCLPLLPAEYIGNMFMELRDEANKIDRSTFRPFLQYFYKQWIVNVSGEQQ